MQFNKNVLPRVYYICLSNNHFQHGNIVQCHMWYTKFKECQYPLPSHLFKFSSSGVERCVTGSAFATAAFLIASILFACSALICAWVTLAGAALALGVADWFSASSSSSRSFFLARASKRFRSASSFLLYQKNVSYHTFCNIFKFEASPVSNY